MDVLVITLFILVLVALYVGWQKFVWLNTEGFQTVEVGPHVGIESGLLTTRPTLWWFVDDETNGRHWWDFGARNSREPNRGYLQVALEALYAMESAGERP